MNIPEDNQYYRMVCFFGSSFGKYPDSKRAFTRSKEGDK